MKVRRYLTGTKEAGRSRSVSQSTARDLLSGKSVLDSRHLRQMLVAEDMPSPRLVKSVTFEVDLQAEERRGLRLKLTGHTFQALQPLALATTGR